MSANGKSKNGNGNGNGKPKARKRRHKFLFVSVDSLSGDLAWQLVKEGHRVKHFIKTAYYRDLHDGFVEKVDNWKDHVDWADVIVFDDIGFGKQADRLRRAGKKVIGGSEYTDTLEEERNFAQKELAELGLNTLPSVEFMDYDEALKFLHENPGRYVYKPSGFVSTDYKGYLFIGQEEDGKDLIELLTHNKEWLQKKIRQFQLQKFASGVEVGAASFFNGKEFVGPANIAFEHKRLFPGDIGPMTGEMGTLMYWSHNSPLFEATMVKMKEKLAACGYVGYIDINCIVNARGVYPLEFTCRFGYPTISIQMEGVQSDWGEFFYALASGEQFDVKTKTGFQVGVVCATPPFPFVDQTESDLYRHSSIFFKRDNLDGIHLGDVKFDNGVWRTAGDTGYTLVVTGSGNTVDDSRRHAYGRIDNIRLQNMFYRTDIGANWDQDSDKLHSWGYL